MRSKTKLTFIFISICIIQTYCAKSSYDVTTEKFLNEYNNTVSIVKFYKSMNFKINTLLVYLSNFFQLFKSEIKVFNDGHEKEKIIAKVHMDENLLISDYRVLFQHTRNKRSLDQDTLGLKFKISVVLYIKERVFELLPFISLLIY